MKTSAAVLALLLVTSAAFAQDAPRPDYTRPSLLRLFVEAGEGDSLAVRYRDGAVSFRALGTSWQINYPQLLAPLSGTAFGSTAVTQTYPDPFALTGTPIATSKRAWRTRREINAELRRIDQTERAKVRVTMR
jgi:hypothetical protein